MPSLAVDLRDTGGVTPAASTVRLIAIDLDGTLLNSRKQLDPDFPALLDLLRRRGVTVVPASGRQWESIRRVVVPDHDDDGAAELLASLDVIAENGALLARGTHVVATDPVPRSATSQVLDRVAQYNAAGGDAGVVICGRRSAYTNRDDDAFLAVARPYYPLLEVVADLDTVDDDVLKLAVWDPSGAEHGALPALGEIPGARLLSSAKVWVDVMSPTADKGRALGRLQEELGITPEQTMAFGDYPNDLGMLSRAAWSFAMTGAHPEVVAAARSQAPGNDEQGVTRTIREMLGL